MRRPCPAASSWPPTMPPAPLPHRLPSRRQPPGRYPEQLLEPGHEYVDYRQLAAQVCGPNTGAAPAMCAGVIPNLTATPKTYLNDTNTVEVYLTFTKANSIVSGSNTVTVRSVASCSGSAAPTMPMLVLDPTAAKAFWVSMDAHADDGSRPGEFQQRHRRRRRRRRLRGQCDGQGRRRLERLVFSRGQGWRQPGSRPVRFGPEPSKLGSRPIPSRSTLPIERQNHAQSWLLSQRHLCQRRQLDHESRPLLCRGRQCLDQHHRHGHRQQRHHLPQRIQLRAPSWPPATA